MEEYVLPHLYSQCAEQLPAAPIRLDFPHHFLVGNPDDLNRSFDIRVAQETSDGNLAVRRALLRAQTTGRDIIPVKIAADANDNLTLVDFIFSQFRRDDPDFDIVRQALRDNGLVALEIL